MPKLGTKDFPVKLDYYYVVDYRRLMDPVLMPVFFPNKRAAQRVLKANYPNRNERKMFSVMNGRTLKHHPLNYRITQGNYLPKGGKYPYPMVEMTKQQKKSFRTLLRRRLRRMGLYTSNRAKYEFKHGKGKKVKAIKNFQRVAKSPNTDAKVFRIDRKPQHHYFIILKKRHTSKRGKLFRIKAIRVNIKNGVFKKVTIYTNRTDIFFPELLENLKRMKNGQGAVEEYTRIRQREQKKVLPGNLEELW